MAGAPILCNIWRSYAQHGVARQPYVLAFQHRETGKGAFARFASVTIDDADCSMTQLRRHNQLID